MRKAIFVFYAEDAAIIAKIDSANGCDMPTSILRQLSSPWLDVDRMRFGQLRRREFITLLGRARGRLRRAQEPNRRHKR